jgi:Raf kinase inhibitor-like YbhB/YbcL family protein
MRKLIIGVCVTAVLIAVFVFYRRMTAQNYVNPVVNLDVTSEAFEDGGMIPVKYTGRGEDISPQLKLNEVNPKAETIAVIMDDIDHPFGLYNHWVIWNIPASFSEIPEGVPREEVVSTLGNAVQGKSHYGGKHYYRGPLPPFGTHDYIFKVYVLDKALNLDSDAGKAELQKAMEGHILQYGELTGRFGSAML